MSSAGPSAGKSRKAAGKKAGKNDEDFPEVVPDAIRQLQMADDPFGPYKPDEEYIHPRSPSWELGLRPSFSGLNVMPFVDRVLPVSRTEVKAPGWFSFNWTMQSSLNTREPTDKEAEGHHVWLHSHLPGARFYKQFKIDVIANPLFAAYLGFPTVQDAITWLFTDGMHPAALPL
jgi:hypothetical protein